MNKIGMTIGLLAYAVTAQATHGGLHGIRDSTGVTNNCWAILSWQETSDWTRCNAASQDCDRTTGYQTQQITCSATEIDGTVSTVSEHLCQNVVSAIGPKPRSSRTCIINWGRCVPPPSKPPRTTASTGGIGYCGASVAVCQAYDDTFGRAPEAGQGLHSGISGSGIPDTNRAAPNSSRPLKPAHAVPIATSFPQTASHPDANKNRTNARIEPW